MVCRGKLIGFLGFDSVKAEKVWPEDIIALLRIVGEIFASALERKRTEEALRESEAQYRILIQTMMEGLAQVDQDYVFKYVNNAFCEMLGYTLEELLGHSALEFIHEDFRPIMLDQIERRKRGETARYEIAWKAKDGRKVYTIVSPQPLFDQKGNFIGSVGVFTDITERVQTEQALRRSEARFRTIIETAPALIFACDKHAILRQVNPAFEKFIQISGEKLLNRPIFETFVTSEIVETATNTIRKVFAGEAVMGQEWHIKRSDGTTAYALVNITPLYSETGEVELALAIGVDITDQKLAEQRRRELELHKRDFYRRTILAATEGKLVITERSDISQIVGPAVEIWEIREGSDLGKVRHAIAQIAESAGMDIERVYDFVLAVGEATTNALKHAHGGTASLHKKADRLIFVMSDNGPGIEAITLPEVALKRGYTTAESLGMGYKAIISVADKVYLATGPEGTTVAIEMALHLTSTSFGIPDTWAKLGINS
jgi:PAS domain S-box-containing protein